MPGGRESISDNRYPMADDHSGGGGAGSEATSIPPSGNQTSSVEDRASDIEHRTSDIGYRTPTSDTARPSEPATPSGSEPPSE
jgi:hypothetical protein